MQPTCTAVAGIAWEAWISEGAAVVQAVGALLILWITLSLWRRGAESELTRAHAAADVFGSTLIAILAELRDAFQTQQIDRVDRFHRKLLEVIRYGQSVQIDRLPRDCMSDFFDVLAHAVEVARVREGLSPAGGWQRVEQAAEHARRETSFLMGRIGSHLHGWPLPQRDEGAPK